MPSGIHSQEWLDQNTERAYPLAMDASAEDVTGTIQLPTDFIVSINLAVPATINVHPAKFYISEVGVDATGFNVTIGYAADDGVKPVAVANVPLATFSRFTEYTLTGVEDFFDAGGHVVFGDVKNLYAQPGGVFTFDLGGGRLETHVIKPQIRGVASAIVTNGTSQSRAISGDIRLVAGRNCRLSVESQGEEEPAQITVHFIDGEGSVESCDCDPDTGEALGPPIRRISGVSPTAAGDISVVGSDCFTV